MRDGSASREKSIEETQKLRDHTAKLGRVNRDTTSYKNEDGKLDKAWHEWQKTFNAIKDPIMLTDPDFMIVQANLAISRFLDKPLDEIVGRKCWQLIHGTNKAPNECPLKKTRHTKKHEETELHLSGKDIWIEAAVDPILDLEGNIRSAIHVIRDITERKKAEGLLREERDKAQKYLDIAGVMLVVIDFEQRVGLINKKGCEILGYSEDEILGKNWFDNFLPEGIREDVKEIFNKVLAGEVDGPEYYENPVLTKDGDEKLIAWRNTILRDKTDRVIGTLSSGEDITDRRKSEQILRGQKEILQIVLDNIPVMIAFLNPDSTHKWVNQAWQKKLGWSFEETQFRDVLQELYPDPEYCQYVVEFIRKSESKWGDFKTRRRDGKVLDTTWTNVPLSDGSNIGIGLDITERKQAEEALRESENLVRSVIDTTPNPIFVKDRDGRYILVNKANAELHGTTPEAMVGKTDLDYACLSLASEQEVERFLADDRMVIDSKQPKFVPAESFTLPDGTIKWFQTTKIPMALRGDPDCVLAVAVDITERKKAEEALCESEGKFRSMFELSPYSTVLLDLEGNIQECNHQFVRIHATKEPAEAQVGRNISEFFPTEEKPRLFAAIEKTIREKKTIVGPVEYIMLREDGSRFPAEGLSIIMTGETGAPKAVLGLAYDITERKRAEQEIENLAKFPSENPYPIIRISSDGTILHANAASTKLLRESKCAIGRLAPPEWQQVIQDVLKSGSVRIMETEHAGGVFAFRAVPVIASGYVNFYGSDITERKQAEQKLLDYQAKLKSLASQLTLAEERERHHIATELHDQISQSLVISKIKLETLRKSASDKKLERELNEICDTLNQTIEDTRTLTFDVGSPILYELNFEMAVADWLTERVEKKHGIQTEFKDDGQPKPLDDDIRMLLFRDVRELLINVIKYAQAKKVSVRISKVGNQICISVEDDGVGFDPTEAASRAAKEGAFGLFSIRQRLEELGGLLEIKSQPGHGCKATMTAPLKEEKNAKEQ